MFKDIKRGFSFSLGKALYRVGVFFIILTIVMMISSCKAHALLVPNMAPSQIYASVNHPSSYNEYFNVYNAGSYYTPRDAGNVLVYFNYNYRDMSPTAFLPNHFYPVDGVDYYFNTGVTDMSLIEVSVWVRSYSVHDDGSMTVITDTWQVANELSNYPRLLGIATISNNQINRITPTFLNWTSEGNGWLKFNYSFITESFDTIYMGVNPYSTTLYRVYNHGLSINSVEVTSGGVTNDTIIDSTNSIINNNNNNTQQIVTKIDTTHGILRTISSGITNVISVIANIPSLVFSAFSSILTNILNAFGTLWTNINTAFTNLFDWLSDIFDSIQDILSDDEPTSQYLEDFIDEFIGSHDNIILEFITLPIQFLTAVINSDTCASISLGTLFGTELVLPCLGSKIASILGSSLYTFISVILAAMIYWRMSYFLYDVIEKVITLSLDVNERFNIDL